MDALIVSARTVHFASALLLFGELLFAWVVARPARQVARRDTLELREGLRSLGLAPLAWALAASVISGVVWLAGEAALMSGKPVAQAIGDGTLGVAVTGTVFGRLWASRLGVAILLGVLLLAIGRATSERQRPRIAIGAILVAALYLATLAWAGHAAAGPRMQIVFDVVHLLAAGAWLGGLPGLVVLLGRALLPEIAALAARRFSTLGVLAVGALVVSGIGNTWYLVGDVPALIGTAYGRLLLAKLALFAVMVALAAINRTHLTVRLGGGDSSGLRAQRLLRRNAAIEVGLGLIVVAIVGLLGTVVPAAHTEPVWPFSYMLSWQKSQPSLGGGAIIVVAGIVACAAVVAAVANVLHKRWRLGIAALAATAAAGATCAWLLAVPAYPTTYATTPVSYSTASIARGAVLFAGNCAVCHGSLGRGDGPAAASLGILPTDLAAHSSSHLPGELFWWVAHGIPATPMRGFTPMLGNDEIWDVVEFLRAQSDAAAATTLTDRVQPWRTAIVAPDFTFEIAGGEQESLRQTPQDSITLLVLYTLPQSAPYLRALAAATETFRNAGTRVVAVSLSGTRDSSGAEAIGNASPIVGVARGDAIASYLMFARQEADAASAAPAQVQYLIDRQGYVRARWIGVPDSPPDRVAETFDQAELLSRERQRAPIPPGHKH